MSAALDSLGDALRSGPWTCAADVAIGPMTTYRVGGAARWFVDVESEQQLVDLAAVTARHPEVPVLVVGRGSNLLVSDAGFAGLAVRLGAGFEVVEVDETSARITAGGAASLPVVARRSVAAGLSGFEWAVGVPGSIGGAVRMNAGGHGAELVSSLVEVRVVDLANGQDGVMLADDLHLSYRHSALGDHQVVASAVLQLVPGNTAAGEAVLSDVVRWRREHQPGGANAGSVFTNPPGDSAGRLIEAVGAKGLRVGSAQVSTKHANFIQADPDGSADDVRALMEQVRDLVASATGVELVAETRMIGFDSAVLGPVSGGRP